MVFIPFFDDLHWLFRVLFLRCISLLVWWFSSMSPWFGFHSRFVYGLFGVVFWLFRVGVGSIKRLFKVLFRNTMCSSFAFNLPAPCSLPLCLLPLPSFQDAVCLVLITVSFHPNTISYPNSNCWFRCLCFMSLEFQRLLNIFAGFGWSMFASTRCGAHGLVAAKVRCRCHRCHLNWQKWIDVLEDFAYHFQVFVGDHISAAWCLNGTLGQKCP